MPRVVWGSESGLPNTVRGAGQCQNVAKATARNVQPSLSMEQR